MLKVHRKVIFNVSFKTTVVVLILWAVLIICKFMGQPSWLWVFFFSLREIWMRVAGFVWYMTVLLYK